MLKRWIAFLVSVTFFLVSSAAVAGNPDRRGNRRPAPQRNRTQPKIPGKIKLILGVIGLGALAYNWVSQNSDQAARDSLRNRREVDIRDPSSGVRIVARPVRYYQPTQRTWETPPQRTWEPPPSRFREGTPQRTEPAPDPQPVPEPVPPTNPVTVLGKNEPAPPSQRQCAIIEVKTYDANGTLVSTEEKEVCE